MDRREIDIGEPRMRFDSISCFESFRDTSDSTESSSLLSILNDDGIGTRNRIESTRSYSILLFADESFDELLTFS